MIEKMHTRKVYKNVSYPQVAHINKKKRLSFHLIYLLILVLMLCKNSR